MRTQKGFTGVNRWGENCRWHTRAKSPHSSSHISLTSLYIAYCLKLSLSKCEPRFGIGECQALKWLGNPEWPHGSPCSQRGLIKSGNHGSSYIQKKNVLSSYLVWIDSLHLQTQTFRLQTFRWKVGQVVGEVVKFFVQLRSIIGIERKKIFVVKKKKKENV